MNVLAWILGKMPASKVLSLSCLRYRFQWLNPIFELVASYVRNRDLVIQRGIGKGLRFNCGRSNASYVFGAQESHVQTVLAKCVKPAMVTYDIGANVGFFSLIMARLVSPNGRVVAFDPLPENARQVAYNLALNRFDNIMVRAEAVGDREDTAVFQVSSYSSMGRLKDVGVPPAKQKGTIAVPLRSLDRLIEKERLPSPNFMKIDVEGAEPMVLSGATQTLATARPIMLIELHGTNRLVAQLLGRMDYDAHVLGRRQSVTEAHWNAHVLAVPHECRDLNGVVNELTQS
jgi:FkbM family methyltransferase